MRILLVCSAGMSTSLLVDNMKKYAGPDDFIMATAYTELEKEIDHFDVVLVGPQMGYKYPSIAKICNQYGAGSAKIDMVAYGRMDGKAAYQQAKSLFEAGGK